MSVVMRRLSSGRTPEMFFSFITFGEESKADVKFKCSSPKINLFHAGFPPLYTFHIDLASLLFYFPIITSRRRFSL